MELLVESSARRANIGMQLRQQAIELLFAYETAPGLQTGSGYAQLGSNSGLGSEVCS